MVTRIASIDLAPGDVPDDVAATGRGHDDVVAFAETFNGYAWGGGPHVIGPRVQAVHDDWSDTGNLPDDVDLLRGCLFHWARARRHGAEEPLSADDRRWLNALLDALRSVLATSEGPREG